MTALEQKLVSLRISEETTSRVVVYNLSNDEEQLFIDIKPVDAIINASIIGIGKSTQLHNQKLRDDLKSQLTYGDKTIGCGDYCVIVKLHSNQKSMN